MTHRSSEQGQDMAEYALLLAFLSLVAIASIVLLNTRVSETFQAIGEQLIVLIP